MRVGRMQAAGPGSVGAGWVGNGVVWIPERPDVHQRWTIANVALVLCRMSVAAAHIAVIRAGLRVR